MLEFDPLTKNVWLLREEKPRPNSLNSLLIENKRDKSIALIDANYPFNCMDDLYAHIKAPARGVFYSHCHLDHVAHAFMHVEKYRTPIFCPVQEAMYVKSLNALMEMVGLKKLGLTASYEMMVNRYMKFEECDEVNTYVPGEQSWDLEEVLVETIHTPGHSPGHTAFVISPKGLTRGQKILYSGDIAGHPYYGDLNSNLKEFRESLYKIEKLYLSDDFILIPAHGKIYLEKDPDFFDRVRRKIDANEKKVLKALSKSQPKSIKDLVYEGIMTPLEKMVEIIKDLYSLWDGGQILLHLQDLVEKGLVQKVEEIDLLNDKYILT